MIIKARITTPSTLITMISRTSIALLGTADLVGVVVAVLVCVVGGVVVGTADMVAVVVAVCIVGGVVVEHVIESLSPG